ncbi:MAG: gliding motility-associated C-terminal domain-containing protein [Bacteroidales bacterium]|nr:gliding motility-associated C-terminal domain-containing protein [Bacteroidales bacterium]
MHKKLLVIILLIIPFVGFSQVTASFSTSTESGAYCIGDTIFFSNTSTGSYVLSYWDFGDGYDTWANEPYHIYETTGTYNIALTVTDASGNSNSTSSSITVNATPIISLIDDSFLQSISIQTTETSLTYEWLFNADTTDETDTVVYYLESGNYSVIATNTNGCTSTESIVINLGSSSSENPEDTLKIIVKNNILTPGVQDGANDILFIEGLSGFIGDCRVVIYNKWGQMVYLNNNYTNFGGFEGRDNNGRELDAGTYYYVITNENRKTATGFIDLIR